MTDGSDERLLPDQDVVAIFLAGGLSRRMGGGDKALTPLAGRTILDFVLERCLPQCRAAVLNANPKPGLDDSRFERFALPQVADNVEGFAGPLAGILAGLDWAAAHHPSISHCVSIATDAPFIPHDLVLRMIESMQAEKAMLACAASRGRAHPVFGLWPVALRAELRHQLVNNDIRKIDRFTAGYPIAIVEFDGVPDPFFNLNTREDLVLAERALAQV